MEQVKLIQVIFCEKVTIGKGEPDSPMRRIIEIFDTEGKLLAKNDPCGNYSIEDLNEFALFCYSNDGLKTNSVDRWREKTGRK